MQCIPICPCGCTTTVSVAGRSLQHHFEEAVDDDDEFWDIGGKSLASDILRTFATDSQTEAPALEHLFQNCLRAENCEALVWRSL